MDITLSPKQFEDLRQMVHAYEALAGQEDMFGRTADSVHYRGSSISWEKENPGDVEIELKED